MSGKKAEPARSDDHTPQPDDTPEKTCFVIMPISDVDGYPAGHFAEVYSQLIEPAVRDAGYVCSLATSTSASHMIQVEVVTRVATADLCICDLSTNNPNVMFEYGIRQAFDKPTVLIKDDRTRRIFDLSGFRDIEYDHTLRIQKTLTTRTLITTAIDETVRGNTDDAQVFSLVKLMKLTKAALPSGELSQDDARFRLLEQKLDSISATLLGTKERAASIQITKDQRTNAHILKFSDGRRFTFYTDHIVVADAHRNRARRFYSLPELMASDEWAALTSLAKNLVEENAEKFSPDIIPF